MLISDLLACADWLYLRGREPWVIVGTSRGVCIALPCQCLHKQPAQGRHVHRAQ